MPEPVRFYLRFTDSAEALTAAQALGFAGEDATELAKDGWYTHPDTGELFYFNIDVLFGSGAVFAPTGDTDADGDPIMAQVPGFHINGLWHGPQDQAPDFGAARIYPATPACVFG